MKIQFNRSSKEVFASNEAPLKKRRWDRWLYFIVFIVIAVSFLSWLLSPLFYDKADGVLLQDHFGIKFSSDIRIIDYKVAEGENVKRGDTLFVYERYTAGRETSFRQDSLLQLARGGDYQSNIIAVEGQIAKREIFMQELAKRLEFWENQQKRKEKLVYLDVITPNELANVDRTIDDISYNLKATEAEYKAFKDELNKLRFRMKNIQALNMQSIEETHRSQYFLAPIDGKIDRIKTALDEVVYRGDEITAIIQPKFFVKAFLRMSELDQFSLGDEVTVILPYKHKNLKGRVTNTDSISELKDEVMLLRRYEDPNYGGVIKISADDEERWEDLNYSNIPVKIKKAKTYLNGK